MAPAAAAVKVSRGGRMKTVGFKMHGENRGCLLAPA
jgi:hypothetical protein